MVLKIEIFSLQRLAFSSLELDELGLNDEILMKFFS